MRLLVTVAFLASVPQGTAPTVEVPSKPVELRKYVPPKLAPEPEIAPSEVKVIEVRPRDTKENDTLVLARPYYPSPMIGAVTRGARLPVRGQVQAKNGHGCSTRLWYALEPFGYLCSRDAKPTAEPANTEPLLKVEEGALLPFRYVMVGIPEGSLLPMWATLEERKSAAEPERQLAKGDTIAVREGSKRVEGERFYISVEDKVVPMRGTFEMKDFSEWEGVEITDETHLPFGWVMTPKLSVFDGPRHGKKVSTLERREKIDILEEQKVGGRRMLRIGDNQWVSSLGINEVRKIARPKKTGSNAQWFDADLGEQVLVAYENDKPVYATLVSSGRKPNTTPHGNYPLWGKVSAITMKSQVYDDKPYFVNKVPWVLFFQAHNAIHGAYWHDRFGATKSHGCVNVSPRDARHFFEWIQPALPAGWTGLRFYDLTQAPVVHVHDTHQRGKRAFAQERNIGPPHREDEEQRLEAAMLRREQEAQAAAQQGTPEGPGTAPTTPAGTAHTEPLPPTPPGQNPPATNAKPPAAPLPPVPPAPAPTPTP